MTARRELLLTAVVEAARAFMAANLRAEALGAQMDPDDPVSFEAYNEAAGSVCDRMQELRDALTAERKSR